MDRRVTNAIRKQVRPPSASSAWTAVQGRNGTITAVTVGGGTDGVDLATVLVGSDSFDCPHWSSYSPVVGHLVTVLFMDGSPVIAGRVVGLPSF